ncbi:MAG: PilW family protein [Pyrinomonadaceae bacterium]
MREEKILQYSDSISGIKDERGFTLIELLTSLIIFLIVTGSIFGVMQIAQRSRQTVNQKVPLSKNARVALNLVGRDTYNAGFGYPVRSIVLLPENTLSPLLGLPPDSDATRDTVPPIIAGNNITLNTFNTAPNIRTDQITMIFKDASFNIVGAAGPPDTRVSQTLNIEAATTVMGIDQIVPLSGSNIGCRVNDLFLVTGNAGSALAVATGLPDAQTVQFASGDVLGFNQPGLGGPLNLIVTPGGMLRVIMVTYFVTPNGTLTRRRYVNDAPVAPALGIAFVDDPLIYGVEDFQITYVMNDGALLDNPADPDGLPASGDEDQARLSLVRQIRYTISLRTTDLDSTRQPVRLTMTSTFSTRNLGY